jgi:hypothetical protein
VSLKSRANTHRIKQEIDEAESDYDQNEESTNEMTSFLTEINKLNDNLLTRKNTINRRILELNEELEQLKNSRNSPKEIMDYIYKQRTLRESINQLLKTGNVDLADIKDLKVLKKYLDEITENEAGSSNERVFVTEKTQGYRKEQEIEQSKKRDQKSFYKQSEMMTCFDPYHTNFDTPMNDFYAQGQPNFAYPSKGVFENDNYEDYYRDPMPQMPFQREEMIDNRMVYPSQNPEFTLNKDDKQS